MSSAASRRKSTQEFVLPDGKKVVVTSPLKYEELRRQYAHQKEMEVEVVIHGSDEHTNYLRQSLDHHNARLEEFRKDHGPHFHEWENTHDQINAVHTQLRRISTQSSGLSGNFSKYGFNASLRSYSDHKDEETPMVGKLFENVREEPTRTVKLAKKPVIKQWFHRGLLWRASEQKEIMAIELFFDLVYASIIHDNGERLTLEPDGFTLLRFAITFIMSWKIWTDITLCLSWFESDDVLTKIELLFEISCLLAFTVNITHCLNPNPVYNTYTQLVTFYLAARYSRAIHYAYVAYALPKVRGVMLTSCAEIVLPSALWIASIHVEMPYKLAIIWPALFIDTYGQLISITMIRYARTFGRETRFGKLVNRCYEFYPAINIEHKVGRTKAFLSLVSGYSVVGLLFQSTGGYFVNGFLGKAIMGMLLAFVYNWLYFEVDDQGVSRHAIRRSISAALVWQFAHLPAIMGYIVAASALMRLVMTEDVPDAWPEQVVPGQRSRIHAAFESSSRWLFCGGLAVTLFFMAVITLCHEHRRPQTMRCPKSWRIVNRLVVCVVMLCLPVCPGLRSLDLLAITLGISVWVLIFDIWGASCKEDTWFGEKERDEE
ncbi:hypothetical protein HIM_07471 [Hirsutella minnesotensis 3608]|uniref:Uncharacterized protein n=1 Tax=Hirsutella minnesotensis 3608 TaxID=1043627 RepID=A0A0F7ZYU6_9HYPO|nr:hypothetical protein HIM_07471 [Hirsutella minnesotensis 3608]